MKRREKYLITGASGLLGGALVKRLVSGNYEITCPVRNVVKAEALLGCDIAKKIHLAEVDVENYLLHMDDDFDYIIHCASPTASKYFVDNPVETISFNISTTTAILEYARRHQVKGILYLSSLESYGTVEDDNQIINESFQGYVNPLEVRSSYNIAKRTCECLCHAYSQEYHVPVKIVRLTQVIPDSISENDMRVYAQFARSAANKEDIILHTEGISARQYVYIDDAVEAILTVLTKGISGQAYNVANEQSFISVKDMAIFVQNNFNPQHTVVIKKNDNMGYAPVTRLRLNTAKLRDLGWEAKFGLYEMYSILIENLRK